MAKSKDLFDDSTMSFGEHLEVLRVHLWKGIIGLVIGVTIALFFGNYVVDVVRGPIDAALKRYGHQAEDDLAEVDLWDQLKSYFSGDEETPPETSEDGDTTSAAASEPPQDEAAILVQIRPSEIATALHRLDPERYPEVTPQPDEKLVNIEIRAPEFAAFRQTTDEFKKPITLNVQEAFMTYLKVAFVTGLVLSSPWVFYQLWLFVAAGLYPHERKYVHVYLPMSTILFVGGAVFCFYVVFPFVLDFLLRFNEWLGVVPQIRLSEWISFAIMLPLMFGLSFQLPLVMLFLERISIFDVHAYREKRRLAILVIAILSMFLTPADPMSMLAMMIPLVALYELGILMCGFRPSRSPFEEAQTA